MKAPDFAEAETEVPSWPEVFAVQQTASTRAPGPAADVAQAMIVTAWNIAISVEPPRWCHPRHCGSGWTAVDKYCPACGRCPISSLHKTGCSWSSRLANGHRCRGSDQAPCENQRVRFESSRGLNLNTNSSAAKTTSASVQLSRGAKVEERPAEGCTQETKRRSSRTPHRRKSRRWRPRRFLPNGKPCSRQEGGYAHPGEA